MWKPMLEAEYKGTVRTVADCEGAGSSLLEALAGLSKRPKSAGNPSPFDRAFAQMFELRKKLADCYQLKCPDEFRKESNLPDGQYFYALRTAKGVRAYGWHSRKHPGTFLISHYIMKQRQELLPADTSRVVRNWRKYEE